MADNSTFSNFRATMAQLYKEYRNMLIVTMLCKSFKARSLILVTLQLPNMFKVVSCEVNALSYMEVLNKELLRHLFIY